MKRLHPSIWLIGLMACTALLMAACGGGGGGGSSDDGIGPPPATALIVDEDSAAQLMGLAMFGGTISDAAGGSSFTPFQAAQADENGSDRFIQVILNKVTEEAMALSADYQADGGGSGSDSCPGGGSLTANLRWDGPNTTNCYDWVNLHGSMTMSNCGIDGTVMNGTMEIATTGRFCNPSALSLKFTNLSFRDSSMGLSFYTSRLWISASNIIWSGNTISSMRSVITGDVNGSVDGTSYDAAFYKYTEDLQAVGGSNFTVDVSGSVRGGCLGPDWADIETIQLIEVNNTSNCPTAGQVMVSGTGSEMITFNSDGSVDVGTTHYDSCDMLEGACVAAP